MRRNRAISFLLLFVFMLTSFNIGTLREVKADAGDTYAIIRYIDYETGEFISEDVKTSHTLIGKIDPKTGKAKITVTPNELTVPNFKVNSIQVGNKTYDGKERILDIETNASNTSTNKLVITVKVKRIHQATIINIVSRVTYEDKSMPPIDLEPRTFNMLGKTNAMNISYHRLKGDMYKYLGCEVTVDGAPNSSLAGSYGGENFTVTRGRGKAPKSINIVHKYLGKSGEGNLDIHIGDHLVSKKTGKVVCDVNTNANYVSRNKMANVHLKKGINQIPVTSSFNGVYTAKGKTHNLKCVKVLVDDGLGNPQNALSHHHFEQSLGSTGYQHVTVPLVYDRPKVYVHFYWEYDDPDAPEVPSDEDDPTESNPSSGLIKYTPNNTDGWENTGKIAFGKGDYSLNVQYVGNQRCGGHCPAKSPCYYHGAQSLHKDAPVSSIVTQDGSSLSVTDHVIKEGINDITTHCESSGCHETLTTATSGKYMLDWTNPLFSVKGQKSQWFTSPYTTTAKVEETNYSVDQSGFDNASTVTWNNVSHYGGTQTYKLPEKDLLFTQDVVFPQGIYTWSAKGKDRATNPIIKDEEPVKEQAPIHEYYYVDVEKPVSSFNVQPGVFYEHSKCNPIEGKAMANIINFEGLPYKDKVYTTDNKKVPSKVLREPSRKGKYFAYYGILTIQDNLSGIQKASFSWTYGSAPGGNYEELVKVPVTYKGAESDRWLDRRSYKIEKPVGDNLYLHVKMIDCAGNEKLDTYGPYHDENRLYGFRVTEVKDPEWLPVFYTKDKKYKGVTFKANQLPLDMANGCSANTIGRGYAIQFDFWSEFLYRDKDHVLVQPKFYHVWNNKRNQVDAYYFLGNKYYKVGDKSDPNKIFLNPSDPKTAIGGFGELYLPKFARKEFDKPWSTWKNKIQYVDGKVQYWKGRYFVPSTVVFVPRGGNPLDRKQWLRKGFIIVNFDLVSVNSPQETKTVPLTYHYLPYQWAKEGNPKKPIYSVGDIYLLDIYRSSTDYDANIIN